MSVRGRLYGNADRLGVYCGGTGQITFDNIRLYIRDYSRADFNLDSVVNWYDMKIMSQEWLTSGNVADIFPMCNPDEIVDFRDFAVLADEWLTEILPP